MSANDGGPEMPQPCDECHQLSVAADAAGRWSARQLALRCSAWDLGRRGSIEIHIEPLASPMAAWLHRTGRAVATETRTGVLVAVTITSADLIPAEDALSKACSLLVAHAYAVAYCNLLADEAGVATEIGIVPDALPTPPQRSRPREDTAPARPSPRTATSENAAS